MMPRLPDTVDPRSTEMAQLYRDERLTMQEIGDRYGITRERVRQLLVPFKLERHNGERKREARKTQLRQAFKRIETGKTTPEAEAELLGYGSTESLRVAFFDLGLKRKPQRKIPAAHGTLARYNHHKCRCPKCRKAAHTAYIERLSREPKKHGTASSYSNYGCRCHKCTAAQRRYVRLQKTKKRQGKEPVT